MEEIYKMTLLHILHAIKIIVALRIRLEVDKDFSKENEKDSWANWTSYNFSIGSRELCHALVWGAHLFKKGAPWNQYVCFEI